MSTLLGNRQFLGSIVPFLIGSYPNRVAPSHVFNGFLSAAFGAGPSCEVVTRFVRAKSGSVLVAPQNLAESVLLDNFKLRLLADSLTTIVDPDHRVFPSGGSPFPITLSIVSNNPSDDQFGKQIASLFALSSGNGFDEVLNIYKTETHKDSIAVLGRVFGTGYNPKLKIEIDERVQKIEKNGGVFVKRHFQSIANLVSSCAKRQNGTMSAQLVGLGSAVYLAGFLASLRVPSFLAMKPKSWKDLKPLFVFGGKPPGDSRSPGVRLAIRSYSLVTSEVRSALSQIIQTQLENSIRRVPKSVPRASRSTTWIKLAFPELKDVTIELAKGHIKSASELKGIANRLADAVYPIEFVSRTYRTVGRMLGFVGPDRGAGNPRFLLETPVLALLIESTMEGKEVLPFEDWIDRVYDKYGLILGNGRVTDATELLNELDRPGPLARAIKESQEALRLRLVLAGMAAEYSDGETEIINPAGS